MARPVIDRALLAALDNNLSAANTDKLLVLMPPDWTLLATKHDVAVLVAQRGDILTTLQQELRKQTIFFIGTLIAVAGVLVGSQALG